MSRVIHNRALFVARDVAFTVDSRLVAIGKFFREHPDGEVPTGFWTKSHWNRTQFRRWFVACLQDKINAHAQACPQQPRRPISHTGTLCPRSSTLTNSNG